MQALTCPLKLSGQVASLSSAHDYKRTGAYRVPTAGKGSCRTLGAGSQLTDRGLLHLFQETRFLLDQDFAKEEPIMDTKTNFHQGLYRVHRYLDRFFAPVSPLRRWTMWISSRPKVFPRPSGWRRRAAATRIQLQSHRLCE